MKICIVTIYNGSNYGGFLQAFALKNYIEQLGHDVYHLNNKARNPRVDGIKAILKKMRNFETSGYSYQVKKAKVFHKISKQFKEIKMNDNELDNMDLFVLGSDEIWNITRKRLRDYPSFYGGGIPDGKKIISYAPSANKAELKDFLNYRDVSDNLNKLKFISVRDNHTKKVIEEFTGREDIDVVVDPTMLLTKDYYEKIAKLPKMSKKYIAIYSYGNNLSKDSIKKLVKYAKEKNLKLVSLLEYFDWCDENPIVTPKELLGYFIESEFIFTDTFHGSVFSIILNKEFILGSVNSNKILNLLEMFNVKDRDLSKINSIDLILNNSLNYVNINYSLNDLRNFSRNILQTYIEE